MDRQSSVHIFHQKVVFKKIYTCAVPFKFISSNFVKCWSLCFSWHLS